MATFGFGTVGFFRLLRVASATPEAVRLHQGAITFGVSLVVLGVVATVLSGIIHWPALRKIRRNEAPVSAGWPLSITVALLLAVIGTVSLWSVFRQ